VGPTGNYKTIQAAVNAASTGNTILVSSGTYIENVNIAKTLTLKAASGATPIVDANKKYPGIWVKASNVRVEGFTIQNGGSLYSGIYVAATGATIVNNKISGCGWGIYLISSTGCTLQGNTVSGATTNGISLVSSKNNVVTTSTTSGDKVGLMISGTSTGNVLYLNDFKDTTISVVAGNTFNTPTKQSYTYKAKVYTGYLGNFWTGYSGKDAGGDGIGDTAYASGNLKDNYPLIVSRTNYA
jgi:parallel beta-helix repeat protein